MRKARNQAASVGTQPINTAGVGPITVAKAVTASERLKHQELAEYSPTEQATYLLQRRRFLDEWHALIELGAVAPCWSSFAQRLDYVGECADLEHAEWANKAGMLPAVVSQLRQRARGKVSYAMTDSPAVIQHAVALLTAAGQPIELPWLLAGSTMVDDRGFRSRYTSALKIVLGDRATVFDEARAAGLYPKGTADDRPGTVAGFSARDEEERYAAVLSQRSKSLFTTPWLLTGRAQPPAAIQAAMVTLHDRVANSPMRDVRLDDWLRDRQVPMVPALITPPADRKKQDLEWEMPEVASQSAEEFIRENRAMVFLMAFGGAR